MMGITVPSTAPLNFSLVPPACVTHSDGMLSSNADTQSPSRKPLKRGFSLVPERFTDTQLSSLRSRRAAKESLSVIGALICERFLKILTIALVIIGFPFSLLACLRVIPQYERAVIFRLGRLLSSSALGPGLIFKLPFLDRMRRVDLRTFTFDVPTQEVLTKDSVTVAVEAVVYYRIFDPVMSVVNVENANRSTRLLAQTTLRNVLGTVDLYALLTDREDIAAMMQETLDTATDTWGVKVERVEIKDVRLPLQLQRAMAAEAEATREAKAKVIAAKGEEDASKSLKAAAIEISACPIALQLRYLQTLAGISAEKNSTIVFPLPIDLLNFFRGVGDNVGGGCISKEGSCVSDWVGEDERHAVRPHLARGVTVSTLDSNPVHCQPSSSLNFV
ncbi:unnamed protein product [Mesocestoides corti]|uniref:Band 7 domain-containing protein n=2 Tax=Mesocestoides corti TaxID=53468 RepID=A0A0R3U8B4_MESCO|nr:unnamed protein product [Mesocestoides corti]